MRTSLPFTVLVAGTLACGTALAQTDYPSRPIRLIVPLAPGGTGDTLARIVGENLAQELRGQVVTDNRAGANGIIGVELVVKANPDGYTLLSGSSGNTSLNAALYGAKLPFNVERDLAPVTQVATTTSVVITPPSFPAKSIKELIALAKAKPGTINYASAGTGSAVHLGTVLFESMAGIKMTHVPYKGSTPGRVAVVSGEADLMFDGLLPSLPLIKAGKLRALAVTGPKRSAVVPDIPAIAETVPGYSAQTWYGIFAPARTPQPVVDRLHATIAKILQRPDVRERLVAQGAEIDATGPREFAAIVKSDIAQWTKVVKMAGVKPE
jgi:tripartite-type tricarboxylate transporter receptor subunit TctC